MRMNEPTRILKFRIVNSNGSKKKKKRNLNDNRI